MELDRPEDRHQLLCGMLFDDPVLFTLPAVPQHAVHFFQGLPYHQPADAVQFISDPLRE